MTLPPLKLRLEDYRLIERMINEIPENELTDEETHLRWKVRKIASNIERAIKRDKSNEQNRNNNSQ